MVFWVLAEFNFRKIPYHFLVIIRLFDFVSLILLTDIKDCTYCRFIFHFLSWSVRHLKNLRYLKPQMSNHFNRCVKWTKYLEGKHFPFILYQTISDITLFLASFLKLCKWPLSKNKLKWTKQTLYAPSIFHGNWLLRCQNFKSGKIENSSSVKWKLYKSNLTDEMDLYLSCTLRLLLKIT